MADTAAPVLCGPMSAYTQFGYSYPAASQVGPAYCHPALLVAGQPTTATSPPLGSGGGSSGVGAGAVSPGGGGGGAAGVGVSVSSCCESGRPLVTDPVSGQSVCSCQYDSARLALSSYPRLSSYGAPYPSTDQNPYPSIGVDSSAFYSPLSNPYALKDSGTAAADMGAWTSAGLQPTTGYYPYDPTLAAYGYGAGYDLAARRKNATRESTATLKAWLNEHKKNPYPTKGEKIMLAIITKMTLTQVSTWFANARRRLKKENKMTWEPKNKTDDDDDAIVSDGDDKDKDDLLLDDKLKDSRGSDKDGLHHVKAEHALDEEDELEERRQHHHHPHLLHGHHGMLKDELAKDCGVPLPATKPKIWSLADTAACKTPPPPPAAQQPWLVPAAAPAAALNSFALPSPASSAGAAAPYSRYGGLISAPYGGGGGGGGGSSSGFPEVQTDTPPQTPPNMKLPSVAVTGNLLAPSSGSSCFGGGGGGGGVGGMGLGGVGGMGASSSGYGGHHANAAFLGGFSRQQQQQQPQSQSPHKEQRGLAAMAGVKEPAYPQQQHHHPAMMAGVGVGVGVSVSVGGGQAAQGPAPAEGTAFKPFYKGYVRGDDAAADALEQCVRAGVCDGSVRGGASPD